MLAYTEKNHLTACFICVTPADSSGERGVEEAAPQEKFTKVVP